MTRHKHAQTGLVTPQLPQHWLTAALRVFAMLVLNVVSTIRMRLRRPAVNATRQMPQPLPGSKIDTQSKETKPAVQTDSPTSAHAEQRSYAARPSKHERVLTTVSSSYLEADIHVRVPGEGRDPDSYPEKRATRPSSGPPPALGMRLLKQLATNKNAAA